MTSEYLTYLSKVDVLRELDSLIDFARGSLQLKIILALARSSDGLTARDISDSIGLRYKAVQDSIRKLISKGLVVKESDGVTDVYKLSSEGLGYVTKLVEALNGFKNLSRDLGECRALLPDFISNMSLYDYVADAVIAIATSRKGELPLTKIAEAMKLSPERAKSYLDMFSERSSPLRIFKRFERESRVRKLLSKVFSKLNMGIRLSITQQWYRLTDEGMTVFYRHPYYLKYRRSGLSRIATLLIGSAHPRIVTRFISRVSLIMLAVSMGISLLNPHVAPVVLAISIAIAGPMFAAAHNTV